MASVRLASFFLIGILFCAPAAFAADDKAPPSEKSPIDKFFPGNPHAEKLDGMAADLFKTLSKDEMQKLVAIRTGMQMVRAVETVHDDIALTTKLCTEANPDMKKKMEGSLSHWQDTVMPLVDGQEKRMHHAIGPDNFSKPEKIQEFLDQLDRTAGYAQGQLDREKVRVTTPDACDDLAKSMDENSGKLADALKAITWPGEKTAAPKTE